jgi:hypothetical protein
MSVPIPAAAAAVLAGVAYGLVSRIAFDDTRLSGYGAMTFAFLVLVPMAVGYLAVALNRRGAHAARMALLVPAVTTLACLAFVLASGLEGVICVILIAPLFVLFAMAGGLMAKSMASRGTRTYASSLAVVLLLPYAAAPLEGRLPLPEARRTVDTHVVVHAEAADVWAQVVHPTGIRREENHTRLAHRIGFPRPIEATLSYEGVGGVRQASFERGVLFRETVVEWEPRRRLSFTIAVDSIPRSSLDEHVTVGGDYFDVLDGTYEIVTLDTGEVELRLSSTHRLGTHFNPYAALWTDLVMRQVQGNILRVVRARAERVGAGPGGGTR